MSLLVRISTLIAGVLGVVLPNVGAFGLPTSSQTVITIIGGALLGALAFLEHPTTQTAASTASLVTSTVAKFSPPPPPAKVG